MLSPRQKIVMVLFVALFTAASMSWLQYAERHAYTANQPQIIDGKTIVDEEWGVRRTELATLDGKELAERKAQMVDQAVPDAFGFTNSGMLFAVSNLRRETINDTEAVHMEVQATRQGVVVYDDYIRIVNPPILVPTDPPTYHLEVRPVLAPSVPGFPDLQGTRLEPILNYYEDPFRALVVAIGETVDTAIKDGPHLPVHRGTTTTVYADTTDGRCLSQAGTWAGAQTGTDAGCSTAETNYNFVGSCQYTTGTFAITQAGFAFDTSAIGSDTVDDVTFSFVSNGYDGGNNTGTLEVRASTWSPTYSFADQVDYSTAANWTGLPDMAQLAVSSWTRTNGTRNDLTEGADATANINGSGDTEVLLVNSVAYGSAPVTVYQNSVGIYFADNTGTTNDPRVVINHTAGGGPRRVNTWVY